jgi:hypothetical protein
VSKPGSTLETRWLFDKRRSRADLGTAPNIRPDLTLLWSARVICTATYVAIQYPQVYEIRSAGQLALARVRDSLLLEVPTSIAARHEFARDSAHRADDYFLVLEDDSETRIRLFYENLER